ncbi:MAG: DUF126 domain-containing protein [Firmicutes bacterium]|nr:DUF126 domain-containing protein [Bacillota bacterium]
MVLKGRVVGKGVSKGVALVTREPISFNNGVEPTTGCVIEVGHELYGQKITGRVLVFPVGKGSTGGSYVLYDLADRGLAPAAIINSRGDPVIVTGCIMGKIVLVHRCDKDPVENIRTGDWVEVDAERGVVIVTREE